MTLSRDHRNLTRTSIDTIFRAGKVIRGDYLSLRFIKKAPPQWRGAVTIATKLAPQAVYRNKLRRRLGRLLEECAKEDAPLGVDIIISLQRIPLIWEDVEREFRQLYKHAQSQ